MKIALIGYGKMGRMIEQIARGRGHEIVCIIDVDNQQDFDSEAFNDIHTRMEADVTEPPIPEEPSGARRE